MSLPVIIQPRAKADLRDAVTWWAANRSAEQALRWYEGILGAIESLGDDPKRYPLARESDRFSYEMRQLNYGIGARPTHRVLFTIRPGAVVVLAVRHAAQQDFTPE
jgi:plasmid stabilization system protein ParE